MGYKRFWLVSLCAVAALVFSLAGGGLVSPRASQAQYLPLTAEFVKPTPDPYSFIPVCNNFVVKIKIENPDEGIPADNVTAELWLPLQQGVTAPAGIIMPGSFHLLPGQEPMQIGGDIPPGGSWTPSWKLHCDGAGPTYIQVVVDCDNLEYPQYYGFPFYQGKPHLKVTITAPPDGAIYEPCNNFVVTATVKNTGEWPAYGATLTAETNNLAKLVEGETATKKGLCGPCDFYDGLWSLGIIPDIPKLLKTCIQPGESCEVSWELHCEGPGDAVITVKPDGYMYGGIYIDSPNLGNGDLKRVKPLKIPDDNLEEDSITVRQEEPPIAKPRAQLCADIPGCPHCFMPTPFVVVPKKVAAGQPVTFTASVSNGGDITGNYEVSLKINGEVEQTKTVTVTPQTASPVSFTVVKSEPGTYTVDINGRQDSFVVKGSGDTAGATGSSAVVPIIASSLLVILVVAVVLIVRRRSA